MRSQSLGFGRNSSNFDRVSLRSELVGCEDQLIKMNLKSGWFTTAPRPEGSLAGERLAI
ncbi:hypothetical protein Ancab_010226, partial [Ancistrocladus abbreviatus]